LDEDVPQTPGEALDQKIHSQLGPIQQFGFRFVQHQTHHFVAVAQAQLSLQAQQWEASLRQRSAGPDAPLTYPAAATPMEEKGKIYK
jgi:hypothetical protein